jgi:hypothetical protein
MLYGRTRGAWEAAPKKGNEYVIAAVVSLGIILL